MHVADDVHTCDIRNPPAACVTGGFLFFLVPKYSGFVPHCFHRLPSEFHRVSARLPPDFRAVPLPFHFRSACVPRCSVGVPQCSAGLPLTSTCFLKWFHMRAARITAACRQSSHAVGLRRAWSYAGLRVNPYNPVLQRGEPRGRCIPRLGKCRNFRGFIFGGFPFRIRNNAPVF